MRKLIFILGLSLMTTGAFAGNTEKEKSENKNVQKENQDARWCCTATLTYNGVPVDSATECADDIPTACSKARAAVLAKNPDATP